MQEKKFIMYLARRGGGGGGINHSDINSIFPFVHAETIHFRKIEKKKLSAEANV